MWDSLPITEKNSDVLDFNKLNEAVKINQFPSMHELGRKDSLFRLEYHLYAKWITLIKDVFDNNDPFRNYATMRKKFGKADFDFMPLTFILPADKKKISRYMSKHPDSFWIIKPPNLYCGMGIKVVNKFNEIPNKKSQLCVQSYIKNPYLINNLKFDLR